MRLRDEETTQQAHEKSGAAFQMMTVVIFLKKIGLNSWRFKKTMFTFRVLYRTAQTAHRQTPSAYRVIPFSVYILQLLFVMLTHWLRLPGVLSVVALLLFSTCKKDDGLPPATQEGKNTFGCKVNGKVWIPNGGPGFMGAKPIEGGFYDVYKKNSFEKHLGVYIRAHMKNGEYINVYLQNSQIGIYQLNKNTSIIPNSFYPENYGAFYSNGYFVTNSLYTGEIKITKSDTLNLLISGTFEFKASKGSGTSQQVVSITDGRFDLNMKTLN